MAKQLDRGKIISRTLIDSFCQGNFLSHILTGSYYRAAFTFQDTGEPFYHMLFYHNAARFPVARTTPPRQRQGDEGVGARHAEPPAVIRTAD